MKSKLTTNSIRSTINPTEKFIICGQNEIYSYVKWDRPNLNKTHSGNKLGLVLIFYRS